jgi:hypothetical protein
MKNRFYYKQQTPLNERVTSLPQSAHGNNLHSSQVDLIICASSAEWRRSWDAGRMLKTHCVTR